MRTAISSKIPNLDRAGLIARDELSLIRMEGEIVDGGGMSVVALRRGGANVPDFDRSVFGARDEPFRFGVPGEGGDVAGVAGEGDELGFSGNVV